MTELTKHPTVIKLLSQQAHQVSLSLHIPKTLVFFQGHFTDFPVLPGIAQIDFAIDYACKYLGVLPQQIMQCKNVKFTRIISPDTSLQLDIEIKNHRLLFSYLHTDGTKYASGKLPLGATNV